MAKRLLLRDAESISADFLQRILGSLLWNLPVVGGVGTGYSAGVVGKAPTNSTGHLAVTANGTTMVLTILAGWAHVLRDAGGSSYDPRLLFAESDAADAVTVTANSTGSTRNDTVCLRVDMATAPTSDGSNLVTFEIIAGQSGGGLSNAPNDGNLHLPLANIAVANGATSISQGNVTDKRLVVPVAPNVPGGTLPGGYVPVTANQGAITTLVDLSGLTATVTVGAGRRIKISAYAAFQSTVANDSVQLFIVDTSGPTTVAAPVWDLGTATNQVGGEAMAILTPTGGSHTYKLQAARFAGTGTLTMVASTASPCFILVEDIGV
jgi:hypothetical protein